MLRMTAWLIIAFCSTFSLVAQREYRKGFLVLDGKDTLWGFLSYYSKVPDEVLYKHFEKERAIVYPAGRVSSFQILADSFSYIAQLVPYTRYLVSYDGEVTRNASYHMNFLQPLVIGRRLSLYKVTGEERYYVTDHGCQFLEVLRGHLSGDQIYQECIVFHDFTQVSDVYIDDYKETLKSFLVPSDSLWQYVDRMSFSEDMLKQFVLRCNEGMVDLMTRKPSKQRLFTPFIGLSTVMSRIDILGRSYVMPAIRGAVHWLPAVTAGLRWRERDKAGPLTGSLALNWSAFNGDFHGGVDTFTSVWYTYEAKQLSARLTGDYRICDIDSQTTLSVGLFVGYHNTFLRTSPLLISFPSGGHLEHAAERSRLEGGSFGLHVQLMRGRWELSGTWQLYHEEEEQLQGYQHWYGVLFSYTGLGVYYHF